MTTPSVDTVRPSSPMDALPCSPPLDSLSEKPSKDHPSCSTPRSPDPLSPTSPRSPLDSGWPSPLPLVPPSKSAPPSDGSNPRTSPLTNPDCSVTDTHPETLASTLSASSPPIRRNSVSCRPRSSRTAASQCSPPPDSWPRNWLTERESSSTSPPKRMDGQIDSPTHTEKKIGTQKKQISPFVRSMLDPLVGSDERNRRRHAR
mmetsp:Transcript_23168/g.64222  ORF Transcript_23168/g.64222 Transcript_23168/m.64222 type:complete len:203 (-) Transcript_23168:165-773(-)